MLKVFLVCQDETNTAKMLLKRCMKTVTNNLLAYDGDMLLKLLLF